MTMQIFKLINWDFQMAPKEMLPKLKTVPFFFIRTLREKNTIIIINDIEFSGAVWENRKIKSKVSTVRKNCISFQRPSWFFSRFQCCFYRKIISLIYTYERSSLNGLIFSHNFSTYKRPDFNILRRSLSLEKKCGIKIVFLFG